MEKEEKFWLQDPSVLITNFSLLPRPEDTIEKKINAITRIVIIVFIILLIARQKYAATFIIISLLVICLAYYYQKSRLDDPVKEKESNNDIEEERFMAHAGNSGTKKKEVKKSHPRRPFPAAIPEDFVVQASKEEKSKVVAIPEIDSRETYLQALRRKAAELKREEEIADLEIRLGMNLNVSAKSNKIEERYEVEQENDDADDAPEILVPESPTKIVRRQYLSSNEEDYDTSGDVFTPTERPGFRFGMRKRRTVPENERKTDPNDLMHSRQKQLYGQNREIIKKNRDAIYNNVY